MEVRRNKQRKIKSKISIFLILFAMVCFIGLLWGIVNNDKIELELKTMGTNENVDMQNVSYPSYFEDEMANEYIIYTNPQSHTETPMSFHFHTGNNGEIVFCLSIDLKNPGEGSQNGVVWQPGSLNGYYSSEQIAKINTIIENSMLCYNEDKTSNTLPDRFKDLPFDVARFSTQAAIWYTLYGTEGNNGSSATWWKDYVYPTMKNNPAYGYQAVEFFNYLVNEATSTPNAQGDVTISAFEKKNGNYEATVKVTSTFASGGTKLSINNLPSNAVVKNSSGATVSLPIQVQGNLNETYTISFPEIGNGNRKITASLEVKSSAKDAQIVHMIPSDNAYQNLAVVDIVPRTAIDKTVESTTPDSSGVIKIHKKDAATNENVKGAVYTVYSDASCNNKVLDLPATDENGIAVSQKISSGVYWVKETVSPSDYHMNNTIYNVTVNPDTTSDTAIMTEVVDTKKDGKITVNKKDNTNNTNLKGAIYGIYSDSACNNLVEQLKETDENGLATSGNLRYGTYWIREIKAPYGFTLDSTIYEVQLNDSTVNTTVTLKNNPQYGNIKITKQGESVVSFDKNSKEKFTYQTKNLANAEYDIYANEQILASDNSVIYEKDQLIERVKTGSDGTVTSKNLPLGKYYIIERVPPVGYKLDSTLEYVEITYQSQDVNVVSKAWEQFNNRQKVSIEIEKYDKETNHGLEGVTYGLYAKENILTADGNILVNKDELIEEKITDKDGKIKFESDLPYGSYYVKEIESRDGYVLNDEILYIDFNNFNNDNDKFEIKNTLYNDRVKGTLTIVKKDALTNTAQGNATLEGAVYALYAKEDILSPDGSGNVLHKKDSEVVRITTDKNGSATTSDLTLGKYYLKEVTASNGYLLDKNVYDVDLSSDGKNHIDLGNGSKNTTEIKKDLNLTENIIGRAIQIIKKGYTSDSKEELLEGAGFNIYLKSNLVYKQDGSIDYNNSPLAKDISGNIINTLFTDANGYILTPKLPFGEYLVSEVYTPENRVRANDFTVMIDIEDTVDSNGIQNIDEPEDYKVIIDENFRSKLRLIKKDEETKKNVAIKNTEFKITNLDTGKQVIQTSKDGVKHDSFFTDENGEILIYENLEVGNYRIEELNAPNGYYNELLVYDNNAYVDIHITTGMVIGNRVNGSYDVDVSDELYNEFWNEEEQCFVIPVNYENPQVKGSITVTKKGEVLDEMKEKGNIFTDILDNITNKEPEHEYTFKEQTLSGAYYKIVAAEDIYSSDNSNTIIYKEGESLKFDAQGNCMKNGIFTELKTGEDGTVTFSNIPIGKYKVIESKAPEGYVVSNEEKEVEITWENQQVPVINRNVEFVNERQKVSISLVKKDDIGNLPLKGVRFGLYVKEVVENDEGEESEKYILIEEKKTDSEGKIKFETDLPFGRYYVKEIEPLEDYLENQEEKIIDFNYTNQDESVQEFNLEFINTREKMPNKKVDVGDGNYVNPSQILTYRIVYENLTDEDETVKITDSVPEGTTYVKGYTTATINGEDALSSGKIVLQEPENNADVGDLIWNTADTYKLKPFEKIVVTFKVKVQLESKRNVDKIINDAQVEHNGITETTNEVQNPIKTPNKEVDVGDKTGVVESEELTYTIYYRNDSDKYETVKVTDKIPEGVKYVKGSMTAAINGIDAIENNKIVIEELEEGATSGNLTWSTSENQKLAPKDKLVVSFKVKVLTKEEGLTVDKIINSSQVLHNNIYDITNTVENPVGNPVKSIDVGNGNEVSAGNILTYKISYKNLYEENGENVIITDMVPEGTEYVGDILVKINGENVAGTGRYTVSEPQKGATEGNVVYNISNLAKDEIVEVTYKVKVRSDKDNADLSEITNTASVEHNGKIETTNEVYNPIIKLPQTGGFNVIAYIFIAIISASIIAFIIVKNNKKARS